MINFKLSASFICASAVLKLAMVRKPARTIAPSVNADITFFYMTTLANVVPSLLKSQLKRKKKCQKQSLPP